MKFTVLGAEGLVGRALAEFLSSQNHDVIAPARNVSPDELISSLAGHVIYCIGLTADFRSRPWDTVDAHVGLLRRVLAEGCFDSFTYLSSTRVYLNSDDGLESSPLIVSPENLDYLYNLSKLMGESLCHVAHKQDRPVRVVRLSNVVSGELASDNFIYTLMRQALATRLIEVNTSLDSFKDYIALDDVVSMLEKIALYGRAQCYNLASGQQTSHANIVQTIASITGAKISLRQGAQRVCFPRIDISLLRQEFDFSPQNPLDTIKASIKVMACK